MTIRIVVLSLLLTACGAAASLTSGDDAGATGQSPTSPGRDAWTDVGTTPEAASDAGVACGPPTPFGQLACFGHPDAGRAGTSHRDGCDAGDASGCYELVGETPRLWCCPEVTP